MTARASIVGCLVAVFTLGAAPGVAQTNDFYEIHETYPFAASQAVASDAATATIYMGSGSGFMALDGTNAQPSPLTGSGIADYRARCRGFVRSLKVTDDWVYAAAGVGGLQRWNRSTNELNLALDLDESLPNAWCLSDVFHLGTSDFIVVGSNDLETHGKVYLVEVTSGGTASVRDSIELLTPVYTVAAATTLESNTITVLAGKRCHPQIIIPLGACDSLQRFDIPTTGTSAFQFPSAPDATWSQDCNAPVMVRDILIDDDVAYVAASVNGIHKLDLSNGGLTEVNGNGWPISSHSGQLHFDSLALFSESTYKVLVAAVGPRFAAERQFWGELNVPYDCDGGDASVAQGEGIYVFDLNESPVSSADGSIGQGSGELPGSPLVVSVRSAGAGDFRIDVACDVKSLAVVTATRQSNGNWDLDLDGLWSDENPTASEKVPGGSFDDVAVVNAPSGAPAVAYAYVTTESKLLAFPSSAMGTTFENFSGITAAGTSGAIILARISPEVTQPVTVIYSETFVPSGDTECRFYDIAINPGTPVPSTGTLDTHGRSYCTFLSKGFDDDLLLYVVNQKDEDGGSTGSCGSCSSRLQNGGVRVYRVTDANGDQVTEPSTTATPQLGQFVPSICCDESQVGTYLDAYVQSSAANSDQQYVWVTYGPREAEEGNGLMTLLATWNGTGIDFSPQGKVPFEAATPSTASRLTFDPSRNILYAAYGTAGVAIYDVGSPGAPSELAHYYFPLIEGHAMSALQVWPGPGDYVYVSLMGYGVGVIDATSASSFAEGFTLGSPYKLPGVCNAFAEAPVVDDEVYPLRSAVYVADGRGGVHWVQFKVFN